MGKVHTTAATTSSEEWTKFDTIFHTAHLTAACRIADDQQIKSQLIYDGKLKSTPTKVVFLSPNHWGANGYVYGSIQFVTSFEAMIGNRKLFWVEDILEYKTTILRFLASRHDWQQRGLQPYNPSQGSGPLRKDGDSWFYLKKYAIEIALDEDLNLTDFHMLNFVQHHDEACVRSNNNCQEKGRQGSHRAWAAFFGHLIGMNRTALNSMLVHACGKFTTDAESALHHYLRALEGQAMFGGPINDDAHAADLLRAASFDLFSIEGRQRARRLVSLIDTRARYERAASTIIGEQFGLPGFCLPD
jgi:hypothetical protein